MSRRLHRRLEEQLVHVAPAPVLAGLEAPHDGVAGRMEVLGGMSAWRVVATADVAALLTQPQVDPAAARGQTFLATSRGLRIDVSHLGEVRTARWHGLHLLCARFGRHD